MRPSFPLLLGLLACTGGKKDGADSASSDSTEPSTVTEDSPVVSGVGFAVCAPDTDGVDMWSVSVNVSDPQDDIASTGASVSVMDGADTLAVYDLACGSGSCSGSFSAGWDGVDCVVGKASVFRFVVVDELGNTSAAYDHTPV